MTRRCPTSSTSSPSRCSLPSLPARCPERRWAALGLLALLAGCGDLPQPFAGHPGALAERLAQPPPARLDVPVPTGALLGDAASATYEAALVAALQDREVPAVADVRRKGDWGLVATAELRGDKVVPMFTVQDPSGAAQGSVEAPSVDAAQWAEGGKAALESAAAASAPTITNLLTQIDASRRLSDPHSLLNRPARLFVNEVTGAPGDGNHQLARNLRQELPKVGEVVQDNAAGADFVVQGEVKTAPGAGGTERIEIQWIVRDAQNRELGRIVQLNDIQPGTLDHYWGDVALVVAQEAASGVREVILNQLGGKAAAKPLPKPAPAAAPATPAQGTASGF